MGESIECVSGFELTMVGMPGVLGCHQVLLMSRVAEPGEHESSMRVPQPDQHVQLRLRRPADCAMHGTALHVSLQVWHATCATMCWPLLLPSSLQVEVCGTPNCCLAKSCC